MRPASPWAGEQRTAVRFRVDGILQIKRRLTGQIAGMVGAYGNVGGVLYLTLYSFVSVETFFLIAAASAASSAARISMWPAICVGVGVAAMVLLANVPVFASIPSQVYGFAATVALTLPPLSGIAPRSCWICAASAAEVTPFGS